MPAFPSVSAVAFIMYCRHNWANLMTKIKVGFSALNDFESQYCSSLGKMSEMDAKAMISG